MARNKYDVSAVRKKLQEKQGSRFKDPNEFRPPQAKDGETLRYRFFVLPPLEAGQPCADGKASQSMDIFFVQNGSHWYNNRSYQCPRVHDEEDCPMCGLAFEMMGETDDKARRSEIARNLLPRTKHAVNVYFPKDKVNPDDVAGKVMWVNASKQVFDKWEACIMNEDEGDPADPQPFGVFFDEKAAYLFQLTIKKKNQWNDYSESKFLSNLGKLPIAMDKNKNPVESRINDILAERHDLFTKFQPRDAETLGKIVHQMTSGEPVDDDDAGFDEDEAAESKPKASKKKQQKAKAEPEESLEDETVDEEVEPEAESVEEGPEADEAVEEELEANEAESDEAEEDDGDDDQELQDLLSEIESNADEE